MNAETTIEVLEVAIKLCAQNVALKKALAASRSATPPPDLDAFIAEETDEALTLLLCAFEGLAGSPAAALLLSLIEESDRSRDS